MKGAHRDLGIGWSSPPSAKQGVLPLVRGIRANGRTSTARAKTGNTVSTGSKIIEKSRKSTICHEGHGAALRILPRFRRETVHVDAAPGLRVNNGNDAHTPWCYETTATTAVAYRWVTATASWCCEPTANNCRCARLCCCRRWGCFGVLPTPELGQTMLGTAALPPLLRRPGVVGDGDRPHTLMLLNDGEQLP